MNKKMRKKIYSFYNDGLSAEMIITIILQTMKNKTDNEKANEILEFIIEATDNFQLPITQ